MQKVTDVGENHCDSELVCGFNGISIAHTSARLDDRNYSRLSRSFD
jgi:hypothetical protein